VLRDLRQRVYDHFQRLSIGFHERYTSGRMVARLTSDMDSISELVDGVFEAVPQVLVNVALPARKPLAEMAKTRDVIEGVERRLGSGGRVLVRWSGTEPKLRVMVEGPDERAIRAMADSIASAAQHELR